MDLEAQPWDSPKFAEKNDNAWTAGCRWLQSWWREKEGHLAGELSQAIERPVASMLPLGTKPERNFYGANVVRAMDERILNGAEFTMAVLDKLFRDLLSSQTACVNCFGEFAQKPSDMLPWIQTIDAEATKVDELEFAYAPKKKLAVGGGAPFSAFIGYTAGDKRRFFAVDALYAEDLADSKISVRPTYVEFTDAHPAWRDGASRRLDRANLRQFWLNTMLAQSLVEKDEYDAGRVVVVACAHDPGTRTAIDVIRSELLDPDAWLVWSPWETVVETLASGRPQWGKWFRTRYLDFTPVLHMLPADDPRHGTPKQTKKGTKAATSGLTDLAKLGPRLVGEGAALEKLLKRIDNNKVDARTVKALDDRARELADDIAAFREALKELGIR